jgi:hypothetical protein
VITKEELDSFIGKTQNNDWFTYTENAINKILKESNNWTKDWSTVFKRILARIKRTGGAVNPASKDKNGRIAGLPLGKRYYMSVLFQPQKGGCLIYDFRISEK